MNLSAEQCRAARGLLGWSADDLAKAAGVGVATVRRFETGEPMREASVEAIRRTLEGAGLLFLAAGSSGGKGGEGVRRS
ncbi:helix-turn-helix domain-containing protein [Sphingobium sp. PNB]|uniref:helix-turn-helix domain-containing protein n=1 Tax=Sphingobium sp. PNB TaxID=863934 RepID=UPI001CA38790|nr:helix-turn-helix transcriptional regulator [Sphingobium sp. PNB]MCB4861113.1 helix-turn-helix domain-containing protein [Sphingobium sp. PNB]